MQLSPQDQEHVRLLSIFHYILAVIIAMFACIPLIHVAIGAALTFGVLGHGKDAPPAFLGLFFMIFGSIFILAGWTFAVLVALAGKFLSQRRHHLYCLIIAGLSCMWMPFGTVLGVFTFVVLLRPEVTAAFAAQAMNAPPAN